MYTYLFDKPTLFHILCIYLTEVSLMGHKQKTEAAERAASVALEVELEGVEPSSKQGNNTLSTRLFQPWVFELWQDLDHQPQPYPLKFHPPSEAMADYFRFNRTA